MEAVVSEMKRRLEDGDLELELEQKIAFLNDGINSERVFSFTCWSRLTGSVINAHKMLTEEFLVTVSVV